MPANSSTIAKAGEHNTWKGEEDEGPSDAIQNLRIVLEMLWFEEGELSPERQL